MKLIHLPTGELHLFKTNTWEFILKDCPDDYIRFTIPEYWRVEGYEKSWEWMEIITDYNKTDEWEWIGYDGIKVDSYPNGHPVTRYMEIISKAEFEYHIYNPWKEGKEKQHPFTPSALYNQNEHPYLSDSDKFRESLESPEISITNRLLMITEQLQQEIGNEPTPYIKTTATNTAQCDLSKGLINERALLSANTPKIDYSEPQSMLSVSFLLNVINLNPDLYIYTNGDSISAFDELQEIDGYVLVSHPIKKTTMPDIDTLKQQAENMGYELVRKERDEIEWELGDNIFVLNKYFLNIKDRRDDHSVWLDANQTDTLIEKYKKYHATPTT